MKKDVKHARSLFSYYLKFAKILKIMGICELELIDNVKNKYDDSIKSIKPTNFGTKIYKFLTSATLDYLNVDEYRIYMFKEMLEIEDNKVKETFFKLISKVFEPKLIEKTIKSKVKINRKGTYILKVSLDKNLWRVIKLSHKTRLHRLHLIIQEAFDFDNDHMYGFYTLNNYRKRKEFYSGNSFGGSEEYEDLTIEDVEIYKGKKFGYLFDFGDKWRFEIQVIDFIENEETALVPQIIERKGESVQQYPDWD